MSFTGPKTISMSIDDQRTIDAFPLDPDFTLYPAVLNAGLQYVQVAAGRAELHVDDLTADVR